MLFVQLERSFGGVFNETIWVTIDFYCLLELPALFLRFLTKNAKIRHHTVLG